MASKNGTQTKNRPVQEIRMGRIKAAIWARDTDNDTLFNTTFARLYKDGDTWKDSTSFGRDDLPLLAKVADLCHSWIFRTSEPEKQDRSDVHF